MTNPTILMIDADEDDRALTNTIFTDNKYGISIKFLGNSQEVFPYLENSIAQNESPNLILLNRKLTPDDGLIVLERLKSHDKFRYIPVIMLSESSDPAEVKKAYELGVNSFIKKPFTGDGTMNSIDSFVKYWFETNELPIK